MTLTEAVAKRILKIYGDAWVNQDVDKIISIFCADGIYHERVLDRPLKGHAAIKAYWQSKVVEEQSRIEFRILNHYICGNTLIAEWEASFDSNIKKEHVHMKEVAILEIHDGKIKSLREYWQSEKTPLQS